MTQPAPPAPSARRTPPARALTSPDASRTRRIVTGSSATMVIAAVAVTGSAGAAHAADSYVVKAGDTVSHIALRTGTSVQAIARANALDSAARIRAGQVLTIPSATSSAPTSAPAAPVAPAATAATYTVVKGDTVSRIAANHGTTVAAVVAANGLDSRAFIRVGQVLTIPGQQVQLVSNTFAGRTYSDTVVASANTNLATLRSAAVPTKAAMQATVVETARAMGVDPALAQAVAFQESGFRHDVVSPANAIGVMQVIPSSGEWASQLVGRQLNLLDPTDNVVAGVAILRALVKSSAELPTAIAGYYQGATSVKRNGMFADTRRYVANVQTHMARYR